MTDKRQFYSGLLLIGLTLCAAILLEANLAIRLMIGTSLGYVLTRGAFGFAGSINRAYRTGSTKLLRYLMLLFSLTSIAFAAVIYINPEAVSALKIYPLNAGLVIGSFIFGLGMAYCSCCASGALCDVTESLTKGVITVFTFMIGVFIAFPIQEKSSMVKDGPRIFFPDLNPDGQFNGLLLALLITFCLSVLVVYLSYKYQKHSVDKLDQPGEISIETVIPNPEYSFFERFWKAPFSMAITTFLIMGIISLLFITQGNSWGVSTTFGLWFGKLLLLVPGIELADIAAYTPKRAPSIAKPLLESAGSLQNIGILVGAFIFTLTAQNFVFSFKITGKEILLYALGGLLMGVGTRLANGCNAGGLFLPISGFSLSGWVFLVFMSLGAVFGNKSMKFLKI